MMPRLDGFGLVAAIRADEQTRGLPVILLSARAGEESRIEGLAAGADDYLIKPFSARELIARVGSQLELAALRRRQAEETSGARGGGPRKDQFLATLAHELRTPLAPIRNCVHILQVAGRDNESAERVYEMMERQVEHMVRLVDDLMEVSRITRDKIELRKERVDLVAVVKARSKPAGRSSRRRATGSPSTCPPSPSSGCRPGAAEPGPGEPPEQCGEVHADEGRIALTLSAQARTPC
jgi:DNA-binding response OmpR family regulator